MAGQEIVEKRQENTKTYYKGSGKYSLSVFKSAVHYKDNYNSTIEQWKDVDLTIVDGRVTKAPYELTINYDAKTVIVRDKKTGSAVTIGLTELGGVAPRTQAAVVEKGKVTFANVATDTDVVIDITPDNVRFKRVLKSDLAPVSAKFSLNKSGNGINVSYQLS